MFMISLQIPYGDEKTSLFMSVFACKDPNAPVPRLFGLLGSLTGNTDYAEAGFALDALALGARKF